MSIIDTKNVCLLHEIVFVNKFAKLELFLVRVYIILKMHITERERAGELEVALQKGGGNQRG